jgi:hypothetical protein
MPLYLCTEDETCIQLLDKDLFKGQIDSVSCKTREFGLESWMAALSLLEMLTEVDFE